MAGDPLATGHQAAKSWWVSASAINHSSADVEVRPLGHRITPSSSRSFG